MGPGSLYCGKRRKISKLRCDLDLGKTMPNIELVQVFLYDIPRPTQKHTHTDAHTKTLTSTL